MRLADDIVVTLRGEDIELRPSLRHALALFRAHKPRELAGGLLGGSLGATLAVIEPHADQPYLEQAVFDQLDALQSPCLRYVAACMGVDPDAKPAPASSAPAPDPEQTLAELYRIGTGWLGWTPADTLDATPAEIIEAHKGRVDFLKAIFGTAEKPKDNRPLEDKVRSIFAGRTTKVEA